MNHYNKILAAKILATGKGLTSLSLYFLDLKTVQSSFASPVDMKVEYSFVVETNNV